MMTATAAEKQRGSADAGHLVSSPREFSLRNDRATNQFGRRDSMESMLLIIILIVLLLGFGGVGYRGGYGPGYYGGGLGTVVLILIILYLLGYLH